ncbi:DUF2254 family protein [Streptomyces virginiae]|uniref:DUF2254 family protein n=1 Tax=Streptomyces virginiae TaxID=1961 RepID=UPI0036743409
MGDRCGAQQRRNLPPHRRLAYTGLPFRALSPAVNDTFAATTCIDWLGSSLCQTTTLRGSAGS